MTVYFLHNFRYCTVEPKLHQSCHIGSGAGCDQFTSRNAPNDENFELYPVFNGLHSESLDDKIFEVDALVAGSKDDEEDWTAGSSAWWSPWRFGHARISQRCSN